MQEKKVTWRFRVIKWLVRTFYKKYKIYGLENLPDEPCIVVGNHCQLHGPLACELYFPAHKYIWCAGQMMHLKEVPAYAFEDFWSQKPKRSQWYYKLCSYLIAPLSVCIFGNAHTIPVYHDARLITTFKESMRLLAQGANMIVFPEYDKKHNEILYDFQRNFIDIAKYYHRREKKELCFVPMYIAPKMKAVYLGKPTRFSAEAGIDTERDRITDYLMREITEIARALPEHTVTPYRNIPKKLYPKNTDRKEYQ